MGMLKAADVGDVPMASRFARAVHGRHRSVLPPAARGERDRAGGGRRPLDHLSDLEARGKRAARWGMVHIDAHCDSAGEFEGSKFHHGGPFRQAVLDGVLDPERSIQIGIRGGASFLWEISYESGNDGAARRGGGRRWASRPSWRKARAVVGDGPTYVTVRRRRHRAPHSRPAPARRKWAGLTPREALAILRGLIGLDIVGGDVVEVAPQYDATSNTAHVGAQMLFRSFA